MVIIITYQISHFYQSFSPCLLNSWSLTSGQAYVVSKQFNMFNVFLADFQLNIQSFCYMKVIASPLS